MRTAVCNALLKESSIPTNWLRVYISAYFIIIFVRFVLDSLVAALLTIHDPGLVQGRWVEFGVIWFLYLVFLASGILAYIHMKRLAAAGYKWNLVHLCCGFLNVSTVSAIHMLPDWDLIGIGLFGWLFVYAVLYAGIWFVPNLLYFKKRKALFRPYTEREIKIALHKGHSLNKAP